MQPQPAGDLAKVQRCNSDEPAAGSFSPDAGLSRHMKTAIQNQSAEVAGCPRIFTVLRPRFCLWHIRFVLG